MIQILKELLEKHFASENIKHVRDSFFKKIEKVLNITPKEIKEDTKNKANKIIHDAQIEKQKEWINRTLEARQEEIEKTQTPKDIQRERENFRLRMYQATMNKSKESENTLSKK